MLATPASAHTPTWTVDCSTVSINLTQYNGSVANFVTVKADGKVILPRQRFGESFTKVLTLADHSEEVKVKLIVDAGDNDKFDVRKTETAPVCPGHETTAPPTSAAPTSEAPTSEAPTSEAPTSEAPTSEAPTSEAPTSEAPTSAAPTSEAPTSEAPTSAAPSSSAPVVAPTATTPSSDLAETGSSSATPIIAGVAGVVVLAGGGLIFLARRRRGARS